MALNSLPADNVNTALIGSSSYILRLIDEKLLVKHSLKGFLFMTKLIELTTLLKVYSQMASRLCDPTRGYEFVRVVFLFVFKLYSFLKNYVHYICYFYKQIRTNNLCVAFKKILSVFRIISSESNWRQRFMFCFFKDKNLNINIIFVFALIISITIYIFKKLYAQSY